MKNFNYLSLFSFIILVILFTGCEKENVTIPVNRFLDNQDPGINISFINQTAIDTVIINIQKDSSSLLISQNVLDSIITKLDEENLSKEDSSILIKQRTEEEAKIKALNDTISKETKSLTNLIDGKTTVDSLFIVDSPIDKRLSFKVANVFRFPLRPDHTVTDYKIFINGIKDEFYMTVTYNLDTYVVDQVIKRKAENIEIGENTFKGIKIDTKNTIDEHLYKASY